MLIRALSWCIDTDILKLFFCALNLSEFRMQPWFVPPRGCHDSHCIATPTVTGLVPLNTQRCMPVITHLHMTTGSLRLLTHHHHISVTPRCHTHWTSTAVAICFHAAPHGIGLGHLSQLTLIGTTVDHRSWNERVRHTCRDTQVFTFEHTHHGSGDQTDVLVS